MSSGFVLEARSYQVGQEPFLVKQVAAAALRELERKRLAAKAAPKDEAPKADPVAQALRDEAEALRAAAARKLMDAERQAKALIQEGMAKASEAAQKAREEGFNEGYAKGSDEGYEDGLKKGQEEGLQQWAEQVSRWQSLLDSTLKEKEQYFADREPLLVELALKVAAKVIAREAATRPDHAAFLLRQVVRRLNEKAKLIVHLNPSDLEKVVEAQTQGGLVLAGVKQIEFLADDKMVPGGVRVVSGQETLDAAMESQLAEVAKGLLDEASREG